MRRAEINADHTGTKHAAVHPQLSRAAWLCAEVQGDWFGHRSQFTGHYPPLRSVALVGRIAAGLPLEAIEDQQELNLAEMFMGPELFALRVTGDSMVDAGILDEDYVIIRKQPVASDGDIVVAMIDKSEATLKSLS